RVLFSFCRHGHLPALHSFPTRRSSDLAAACGPGEDCTAGACTCPDPALTACTYGCFNTLTDPTHCGAMCVACMAAQTCVAGTCQDRKSTRLNSSHVSISYAVFCLKKKT